jgi:hypothetical protein
MTPGDRVAQLYPQALDKKVYENDCHSCTCSSSGNNLSFFSFIKNTQRFTFKMKDYRKHAIYISSRVYSAECGDERQFIYNYSL